jgi:tetratricopeptide (TPR) repeat protein
MKNSAIVALLIGIASLLTAAHASQNQAEGNPQIGSTAPASGKAAAPDYSREPFIYEFIHASMRYENSGEGRREVTARARINSAVGLNRMGQLVFDYNAANEQLEIRSVHVLKQDGSVVSVDADAVQDLTAPVGREAPMYTDARQKHVTVPALAVGDAVEYNVVTTAKSLLPGQFWQTWSFNDGSICLDEQVDLDVPVERALKIKSPTGVDPTIREEGSRRIYHWATSTTHYPDLGEMLRNFKFDPVSLLQGNRQPASRQIIFSTLQSWAEVGRWYAGLEHDRRIVTAEIRTQADDIVKGRTGDREKAQALYQWVARNIRYVSLSFGVGRYQPHGAAEVLSHRYGDCKDKTTLLEAFLEAEGLRGQAALINSKMQVEADVPSPLQFDHAITYLVLDGQPAWLDSTLGVGPFTYLLPQLRGKQALVVFTDAAPALRKTPDLPVRTLYRFAVNGSVDKQGKLNAVLSLDTRGDAEVLLRIAMMTLAPGQLAALMEKAAQKEKREDFSFGDLKTDDAMDTGKPFHAELRVTADIGKGDLDPPSPGEISHFIRGFLGAKQLESLLPEVAGTGKLKDGDRPLRLNGPTEYSLETSITMPSASTAGNPESVHVKRDFAEYEATSEWNERTFHGRWRLEIRVSEVSANQLKEYASFRKELLNQALLDEAKPVKAGKGGLLVFPPPSLPTAKGVHIRAPETESLFKDAMAEIKLQNWGNAEQKLQAVITLDTGDKSSWNELGRARMYLRKYDAAEMAFRKLMEIAPDDQLSNAGMAWVLTAEKKYDEAAQVLEKRITTAPEDGDAHRRLGLVYMLTKRYDKAVRELEKATALLPRNASAHFLLGRAYLKTHHFDKGAKEFEAGLAIETNDVNLNEAAYELALEKTKLDLAESWAVRAVHDMEVELNQAEVTNLAPRTMTFTLRAGMYWDTLGWIKFQKEDYATAEKYVKAAWQLTDSTTEGYHLGRIYETLKRKDEAIEAYAQTLALAAISRTARSEPSDDEKAARIRLAALLSNDSAVDARVAQSRAILKERRSVVIENTAKAEGMAEYVGVAGADGKIIDLRPSNLQNQLEELTGAIRSAAVPFSFPDLEIARLPFSGVVACRRADAPCKLSIMSAGTASNTLMSGAPQNAE